MRRSAYDAVIIGAGAAGMMAAATAGQLGARVLLIEHAQRLAEKIRISGGGRCNFTNIGASPAQYLSQNPHFCRSALAAYTPRDFLNLVERHGIAWHEKHRGQLFCDESSEDIIRMLRGECEDARADWCMPCTVSAIARIGGDIGGRESFVVHTSQGDFETPRVVLATGGMAIPQLGATDFSLRIARKFGLKIVEPRPALVPLVFDAQQWKPFAEISGVSLEADVGVSACDVTQPDVDRPSAAVGKAAKGMDVHFLEDLLFTHRGLSGPAVLQISSYWDPGMALVIDLAPGKAMDVILLEAKRSGRQQLATVLAGHWPRRLVDGWLRSRGVASISSQRLAELPDAALRQLAQQLHDWRIVPTGTAGFKKAEVMRGGVDTRELNQRTMEARSVPGLFVIGEAVDVTGWLGGYNFQWAWSSGVACGKALAAC